MTGELIAPVGGKIVERNQVALNDPFQVNSDPYGALVGLQFLKAKNGNEDSQQLVTGEEVVAQHRTKTLQRGGWIDLMHWRYISEDKVSDSYGLAADEVMAIACWRE